MTYTSLRNKSLECQDWKMLIVSLRPYMDGGLYFPIYGSTAYSKDFLHAKSQKIDIIFSKGDICS